MQSSARQSWVWSLRIHCWDYPSLLQKQHDHKNHRDHGQGEGNRHDSLLAHNVASQYCGKASAPARIVNVSSLGQQVKTTVNPMQRLACILALDELSLLDSLPNITAIYRPTSE